MAASATNIGSWRFCFSDIYPRRLTPRKQLFSTAKYVFHNPIGFSSKRSEKSFVVGASDPQRGSDEAEENSTSNSAFLPKVNFSSLKFNLVYGFIMILKVHMLVVFNKCGYLDHNPLTLKLVFVCT